MTRSNPSPDPPLSVSHIVAPGEVGGLESVVAALAAGMAERGHRVRVLALLGHGERCAAFNASGVDVIEIRLPSRSYRAEISRLAVELGRDAGVLAHSHGYHADLVGLRAARQSGRPIMSTSHGFVGGGLKNRIYEWLDIRALRSFDGVVAVARPLAERLSRTGVRGERLHLIPNAYSPRHPLYSRSEARKILGLRPEARVAGWVGRLSHEKGPDLFLEALRHAPEWVGSIVGAGPLLQELQGRAQSLGERVTWQGQVPAAGRLLAAFDALVLSSRTEGTPIVLLEGMAAGVPLIATEVGGVPDVVTAAEAILVPSEDPNALARGLQEVAHDPGAAAARALNAKHRLTGSYAVEPWLDRYETVYRGLVSIP